ncbi:hypothetical protein J7L48_05430 [bacterium]|nr:hypothetical protein [bacterium]
MKGQFNIEYMISLVIFITVIIYLSVEISNVIPQHHQNNIENRMYNDALRASEILIKDDINGLVFSPYNFSSSKIIDFNNSCNNDYENLKRNITLSGRDFQLKVYVNSTFNFICGMTHIPQGINVVSLKRNGVTNGEITNIELIVW